MTGRSSEQLDQDGPAREGAGAAMTPSDVTASIREAAVRALLAEEGEASAVADRLHSEPVQILTAVGLRMSAFASGRGTPELAAELQDRIDVAIGQLRRTMHLLRQQQLVDSGLASELRREIEEVGRRHRHLRASIEVGVLPPCSVASALVVLRIAHATLDAALDGETVDGVELQVDGARCWVVCRVVATTPDPSSAAQRIRDRLAGWTSTIEDLDGSCDVSADDRAATLSFTLPIDL